ncbi:flagellar hook-length control protein FliK, partial [Acidocella sp.]|uniref:flagellar hook-length control protein FliK n=1 Tax=Acidocella sp. TaxID=50710 RepID=UPI00262E6D65
HQSGETRAVLRLDPPGLGHLSIQVGLNTQNQVNVTFAPSNAAAAQVLQTALPGLGSALAQSGLSLGQAQVGGQFMQQNSQQQPQNGHAPPRPAALSQPSQNNETATPGISAYA